MTGLTAQDALTPNIIAVGEEMRPRDVSMDLSCEVFAVFKDLPSSLAPSQPPFLGVVDRDRVGRYPFRIFADLISSRNTYTLERSTPLAHVVSRFQHFTDNAVAVFGSHRDFIGVVTRRSLLETLLEHERRGRSSDRDAQAGPRPMAAERLSLENIAPSGKFQGTIPQLAAEWILSDSRERQHVADDIHDRLRQLLYVARLHLDQAQRPSLQGPAAASLMAVDQLLKDSLACTRSLIEELTPAGLRTGELNSALHMLALEMQQGGYPVHVTTVSSNIRLPEPITDFLYRAIRGFLRQALHDGISSSITVSMEGEQESIIRVRAVINGEPRLSRTKDPPPSGQTVEMIFSGIQARGTLLGIAVSVESSHSPMTALVFDIPLPGSFDLL